jgi:prophage tail gpP-like protein
MADTVDRVTLSVGGRIFGGWKRVEIRRSIETFAGGFELEVTERWPGQPAQQLIRTGAACTLRIGSDTVITGYVDAVGPSYTPASHTIRVSGRDAAGDLVDCSAANEPGEWRGRRLEEIAKELCAPFKIPVRTEVSTGAPFQSFRLNDGETVAGAIERMCRHRGVLRMSDGLGGIKFARAGAARAPESLVLGRNVKEGGGDFNDSDRFSHYTVKGQRPGADFLTADQVVGPSGKAQDKNMGRYRPLIILAEDAGDEASYATRARWEANVRFGRARRATYTVQGWRANGALWQANSMTRVSDAFLGIDEDMLIAEVGFKLDEQGSESRISVTRREAFDLIPLPEKKIAWTL